MSKENQSCLSKRDVFEFQKRTISRMADYIYDLEDNLSDGSCTDLAKVKSEAAWLKKALEVELEGIISIAEEYHGL